MASKLSKSDLKRIAEELEEYASGYGGFINYLRGETDAIEEEEMEEDLPWKPVFFLMAGAGRLKVYKRILKDHSYELDEYTGASVNSAIEDAYEYVLENKKEIKKQVGEAFEYLLDAYQEGYVSTNNQSLGWSFDDFLEERDLIEFFLLGVEEQFPVVDYAVEVFEEDCKVRERINELGLENYADEYFPGRLHWYPKRFWWHHRPEERTPHPDGLES
ncbi:MAG: hypothetical protein KC931_08320 [Candidatus Omnitrophica bacterium]|nr:hypothetical protein [Candidatus Omnitrophota bacterium]